MSSISRTSTSRYRDLKAARFAAAIAGGFDDAATASSYNAFTSNMAFTTNEKVLENLAAMIEEGAIDDKRVKELLQERQKKIEAVEKELQALEESFAQGQEGFHSFQGKQRNLKLQKRLSYLRLPKALARYASMPFSKYRSGFVMGVGGGPGKMMPFVPQGGSIHGAPWCVKRCGSYM